MLGRLLLLLWFVGNLYCPGASAQLSKVVQTTLPAASPAANDDPLGRTTPRGAVKGFIEAIQHDDSDRVASYLDTKQRGESAHELARQLGFILDHETSIDLSNLSDKPEGDVLDNVQPNRDLVGLLKTSNDNVGIYVERIQRSGAPPIWLFSSDTLQHVSEIYEEISSTNLDRLLPSALVRTKFLSVSLWRWFALVISIPLVFFFSWLIKCALEPFLSMVARNFSGRESSPRSAYAVPPTTDCWSFHKNWLGLCGFVVGAAILGCVW